MFGEAGKGTVASTGKISGLYDLHSPIVRGVIEQPDLMLFVWERVYQQFNLQQGKVGICDPRTLYS